MAFFFFFQCPSAIICWTPALLLINYLFEVSRKNVLCLMEFTSSTFIITSTNIHCFVMQCIWYLLNNLKWKGKIRTNEYHGGKNALIIRINITNKCNDPNFVLIKQISFPKYLQVRLSFLQILFRTLFSCCEQLPILFYSFIWPSWVIIYGDSN